MLLTSTPLLLLLLLLESTVEEAGELLLLLLLASGAEEEERGRGGGRSGSAGLGRAAAAATAAALTLTATATVTATAAAATAVVCRRRARAVSRHCAADDLIARAAAATAAHETCILPLIIRGANGCDADARQVKSEARRVESVSRRSEVRHLIDTSIPITPILILHLITDLCAVVTAPVVVRQLDGGGENGLDGVGGVVAEIVVTQPAQQSVDQKSECE